MIKRITIRFNLDNSKDAEAWGILQSASGSRNDFIVNAIADCDLLKKIEEKVRDTIHECLSAENMSPVLSNITDSPETENVSEEEEDFLDAMDSFLGV